MITMSYKNDGIICPIKKANGVGFLTLKHLS
jgi:hypothetical protein